jgi:chemotaxis protein methyltransferase CheR
MTAPPFVHDPLLAPLIALFTRRTGQHLAEGRQWRMDMSLRPLMVRHALPDRAALVHAITKQPFGPLADEAIDALLNHESSFFRDVAIFDALEHDILPSIHHRKVGSDRNLRIWCAGAAKGQEPYSLAMILSATAPLWYGWRVSILATDVSPLTTLAAQEGRYTHLEVQRGLPINELLRWFSAEGDDWQIDRALQGKVDFRTENLLEPRLAVGTFDLILCRNVLMYLHPERRVQAVANIAGRCAPEAMVLLGAGETMNGHPHFSKSATFGGAYHFAQYPEHDDQEMAG